MSALKSKIKIGTLRAVGARGEELLESVSRHAFECEGGKRALVQAKAALIAHADTHLTSEKLEEEGWDAEQIAKIKRHFMHAVGIIDNLATSQEVNKIASSGRADGVERMLKILRSEYEAEEKKLEAALEALSTDEPGDVVGLHPGPTIKEQRTAETAEEAPEGETGAETPSEASDASGTPQSEGETRSPPEVKPASQRRRRKKSTKAAG